MASRSYFSPRALSSDSVDAQRLLCRYPDLTDQELAILVGRFRNLPLLDFGLLAADDKAGAKMDAFYAAHGDKLRPGLSWLEWSIPAAAVLAIFGLIQIAFG